MKSIKFKTISKALLAALVIGTALVNARKEHFDYFKNGADWGGVCTNVSVNCLMNPIGHQPEPDRYSGPRDPSPQSSDTLR